MPGARPGIQVGRCSQHVDGVVFAARSAPLPKQNEHSHRMRLATQGGTYSLGRR